MAPFRLLHRLPEELLQDVMERLDHAALSSLNLTSRWCYGVATRWLWREVELTDCRTRRHGEGTEEGEMVSDEHDDMPLVKKLLVLAT